MAEITPEQGKSRKFSGQQVDGETGIAIPFQESTEPYSGDPVRVTGFEGDSNTEITPVSDTEARVRTTDVATVIELLEAMDPVGVARTIPRIEFPPVLTGVLVTYNTSEAAGADSHPEDQIALAFLADDHSVTVSPSSKAQGSASVMPDVQPLIEERFHENVDAVEYTFYMADPSDPDEIRLRVETFLATVVNPWPQFKPEPVTITVKGQSASVSANADTRIFESTSGADVTAGYEWGNGGSKEMALNTKTVRISPTLHDEIVIADATMTLTAEADADASTPDFGEIDAIPNVKNVTLDATGSVLANGSTTIPATTPAGIPASGLYAKEINVGPRKYGVVNLVSVLIVDYANLTA